MCKTYGLHSGIIGMGLRVVFERKTSDRTRKGKGFCESVEKICTVLIMVGNTLGVISVFSK